MHKKAFETAFSLDPYETLIETAKQHQPRYETSNLRANKCGHGIRVLQGFRILGWFGA